MAFFMSIFYRIQFNPVYKCNAHFYCRWCALTDWTGIWCALYIRIWHAFYMHLCWEGSEWSMSNWSWLLWCDRKSIQSVKKQHCFVCVSENSWVEQLLTRDAVCESEVWRGTLAFCFNATELCRKLFPWDTRESLATKCSDWYLASL